MEDGERTNEERQQAIDSPPLSDADIDEMKRHRFQQRVQRVLAVMQEERIDWRGVPFLTRDGRIGVRIWPAEMDRR